MQLMIPRGLTHRLDEVWPPVTVQTNGIFRPKITLFFSRKYWPFFDIQKSFSPAPFYSKEKALSPSKVPKKFLPPWNEEKSLDPFKLHENILFPFERLTPVIGKSVLGGLQCLMSRVADKLIILLGSWIMIQWVWWYIFLSTKSSRDFTKVWVGCTPGHQGCTPKHRDAPPITSSLFWMVH